MFIMTCVERMTTHFRFFFSVSLCPTRSDELVFNSHIRQSTFANVKAVHDRVIKIIINKNKSLTPLIAAKPLIYICSMKQSSEGGEEGTTSNIRRKTIIVETKRSACILSIDCNKNINHCFFRNLSYGYFLSAC